MTTSKPLRCESSHRHAPEWAKAVCAGEADFLAWPRGEWCEPGCSGHPLCGPCAAQSIQRRELRKLEYHGDEWRPDDA